MAKKQSPSPLELQVLSVLWEKGPSTVRTILESMPDGKKRAYTTVLSILQGMERKKMVAHKSEGTAHVFSPLLARRSVLGPLMRDMVRNVFGGSPVQAMQQLIDHNELSEEEIAEIDRLLAERRAGKGKGSR